MDPLSITASVIAILQVAGSSGHVFHKLMSLRDAPGQLQQLWNEAEALRAVLLQTHCSLQRRHGSAGYEKVVDSITPLLRTVETNVLEFEQLIRSQFRRNDSLDDQGSPKIKRLRWLRAGSEIQRIKQKIHDSREVLNDRLALLGLDDGQDVKAKILQIQRITLMNQDSIIELGGRQQESQQEFRQSLAHLKEKSEHAEAFLAQMRLEQRQNFSALQTRLMMSITPLPTQLEQTSLALSRQVVTMEGKAHSPVSDLQKSWQSHNGSPTIRISATVTSQHCPRGCSCQCHTHTSVRTPQWLRSVVGQLFWTYSSAISVRSCNYPPCRKSLGKHHFMYYFPPWLVSRAFVASADLDDLFGAGARVMVKIPLVVPEESHIIWSLVMAGNLEQLRSLVEVDRNLIHIRNQWGQSILHVAAKIHQPAIFNFLLSTGIDAHQPDENQKTAVTTVLTRRGSEEYALQVDPDDLAERLGWTNLHSAAALRREGRKVSEALLQSEYAHINSRDALGRTPLHWLAENGEADAIRLLTRDPWAADVHVRDIVGFTALHCACWADDVDTAAVLLDAGSNPNALDKHARTPLLHFDDKRLLDLMLGKGADVHISDDEGANIMHHVAISDQAALAKTLLEQYGHMLWTTNHHGDTPLGLAIQNNSVGFLEILVPFLDDFPAEKIGVLNFNRRNALHLAALHASTEVMDMLAEANLLGLDLNARDKDGHSPNECFVRCRGAHCAIERKSSAEENASWTRLMGAARGQSNMSEDEEDVDEDDEVFEDAVETPNT